MLHSCYLCVRCLRCARVRSVLWHRRSPRPYGSVMLTGSVSWDCSSRTLFPSCTSRSSRWLMHAHTFPSSHLLLEYKNTRFRGICCCCCRCSYLFAARACFSPGFTQHALVVRRYVALAQFSKSPAMVASAAWALRHLSYLAPGLVLPPTMKRVYVVPVFCLPLFTSSIFLPLSLSLSHIHTLTFFFF